MTLKELDNSSVGGRGYCNYKIMNVGENQAFGSGWVKGGDINNKQQRREGEPCRVPTGTSETLFGEP